MAAAAPAASVTSCAESWWLPSSALLSLFLAGAGLAVRSFWNLTKVDLGVRTDHVLNFGLPVPDRRFKSAEQVVGFYRQLLESSTQFRE